jgi:hypothetical protein
MYATMLKVKEELQSYYKRKRETLIVDIQGNSFECRSFKKILPDAEYGSLPSQRFINKLRKKYGDFYIEVNAYPF